MLQLNPTFTPIQNAVFDDNDSAELLMSSGKGAGKTYVLCWKLYARACIPGACEGLCQKFLKNLKKTTLKTLIKGDGENKPVIPVGTYIHRKQEQRIIIYDRLITDPKAKELGTIEYFGMDDPDKALGLNLTGCAIDEAIMLSVEDYEAVNDRVRVGVKGLTLQTYLATNPKHPEHWLAKRFGITGGKPIEKSKVYFLNTLENPYLPESSKARYRRKTGIEYERNVLGKWVGAEGLIYDNFDDKKHVVAACPFVPDSIMVAADDGTTNASPVAGLRVLMKGRQWHIDKEGYRKGCRVTEQRARVIASLCDSQIWPGMSKSLSVETVVVDRAAQGLIEQLQMPDFDLPVVPCHKANGDVLPGIQKVRDKIDAGELTVSKSCVELLKEFASYAWKESKTGAVEQPEKRNDHLLDALRYLVKHCEGGKGFGVWFAGDPVDGSQKPAGGKPQVQTPQRQSIPLAPKRWGNGIGSYGGYRFF